MHDAFERAQRSTARVIVIGGLDGILKKIH